MDERPAAPPETIADLVHRLAEADARLQDLVEGGVDAVVPPGAARPLLLRGAQEALRRREQEFRALVENNPDAIARYDRDLRHTYANAAAAAVWGVAPAACVGRTPSGAGVPEAAALEELLRRVFETGATRAAELRHGAGDAERFVQVRLVPERGGGGAVESVLAIARDATARRRAEEELRRSQRFLQSTLDALATHVAILDGEGTILAVNEAWRAFARRAGLRTPGAAVGASYLAVCDAARGEGAEEARAAAWGIRAVARGERASFELEYACHAPGEPRWFVLRATPFHGPGRARVVVTHDDTTTRRLAERALRESEARYRRVVETAYEGIWTVDEQARVDYVNPRMAEMLGYAPGEILGAPVFAFFFAEDLEAVRQKLRERRAGERSQHEIRFRRRDGSELWALVSASPVQGPGGEYRGSLAMVTDITERRRSEAALRESEERFRQLAENITKVFWMVSDTGEVLYVSPAYERVWGRSCASLYADPGQWLAAILPGDRERVVRAWERLLADPSTSYDEEFRVVRPGGEVVWVRDRAFPVAGPGGRTYRVAGIAENVTERRRVADALRESEERFRALTENAADITAILDVNGRLAYASPSVARVTGHPWERLAGTPLQALVHPGDLEGFQAGLAALARLPGGAAPLEVRLRHADGSWRLVEGTWKNLLGHPAIHGIVLNAHDLTGRRAAEAALREREEQLRQAQKMEALGRLAGGIAHDFNNLLTAIRGNTGLLLAEGDAGGEVRDALEEIDYAANRAAQLTRQLLAFSRRQVLQPEVMNLNTLLEGTGRMIARLIGEDVALSLALAPGLADIRADPGQVEQVVLNLVVNARDAMPRGGSLTVETAGVDAARAPADLPPHPEGWVRLVVADTGVGMDEETLRHAFDPFFTTKEHGKGTGLGLATAYGIVRQSGGRIEVESAPGRGSRFTVWFPAVGARAAAPPRPAGAPRARGGEVVLLVEDDDAVRSLARRLLERSGYRVLEANDGPEALRVADGAGEIDLVLTDVVMPGMSGRELAGALGALHPEARVLYMSGYTDDAIVHHGVLEDGVAFLEKPFTVERLAQKVREVLDGAGSA